jgi:hypothetical protein
MKQAIPVTRKVIEQFNMGCPVTMALRPEYPDAVSGYNNLWLGKATTANEFYRIAPDVKAWMKVFDLKGPYAVQPFILILDHKARTAEMLQEVTA